MLQQKEVFLWQEYSNIFFLPMPFLLAHSKYIQQYINSGVETP